MKILVTGGAGFIGSQIVDAYLERGHEVSILDNLSTGREQNINPDARFYQADVCDRERVLEIFREGKFDALNHHSAQLDVRVSVNDPQYDAEQNIIGSLNLLQAAKETGVERIVFASSGGTVYGEQQVFPADESHPLDPISPYGVAKLTVEKYLHYYYHVHGIKYAVMRYTNVYGPRQNPHGEAGVIAIFCDRMFKGEQPVINGSGEQTRDYVYVGDVVRANVLATEKVEEAGVTGEAFNVCTNTEITVNELFGMLNEMLGNTFIEKHGPAKKGEQMRSVCTFDKAQQRLGWTPEIYLREGLEKTFQYYKANSQ